MKPSEGLRQIGYFCIDVCALFPYLTGLLNRMLTTGIAMSPLIRGLKNISEALQHRLPIWN